MGWRNRDLREGGNKAAITSEHLKGKVGTYLLSGDATDFPTIYIGEADTISDRLVTHLNAQDKVFWTSFVALMRIGEGLDKTQIQYLESRLVRLTRKANRSKVLNSQNPNAPTLSVQRAEDMETYLDTALAVIGIFGIDVFADAPEKKGFVNTGC